MSNSSADRILNNPSYRELIKRRDTLAWTLAACVFVIYFGFVLMVALAEFNYRVVEIPLRRRGARIAQRLAQRTA